MERFEDSCARNLFQIARNANSESYNLFLAPTERNELIKACIDIKSCFHWHFNFQEFYKSLSTYHYPSLEFLWYLNILQIMPLGEYIQSISSEKDVLEKFTEGVFGLSCQDCEENDAQFMIQSGFLTYFVSKSFPPMDARNCDVKIKEICLETIKLVLQDVFSTGKYEVETKRFICFFSIWNAGLLEEESLLNFCSFSLDYFFNLFPFVEDLEAFEILEDPSSSKSLFHLSVVIEKLLKPLQPDKISCILTSSVQKSVINAASLLVVVSTFLRVHQQASTFISKLVSELMNAAYEKLNYKILLRSLLISYQAAHQTHISPHINYRIWLQTIFKECGRINKQSVCLLIQVLSDIVPYYKNVNFLKIAIDLNISVLPEAQIVYSDYIRLLKTKIQDLQPSSKPEETVEKVLALFENLKKIPPVVMETSLLQKQKFLNEFLPALLVPRVVPPVPDIREKFIEALNKAGKIPANLLQKYKNDCIEEQNKIIAEISVIEDFDDFLDED